MIHLLFRSGKGVINPSLRLMLIKSLRSPCRAAQKLHLASVDASDIIQAIRQASEYLRPNYLITPFIGLPEYLNDAALPDIPCTPGDDFNGFDRTLSAYCKHLSF